MGADVCESVHEGRCVKVCVYIVGVHANVCTEEAMHGVS